MLITQMKPRETISELAKGKTFIICCEGCKEVYFPEREAEEIRKEFADASIVTEYICDPDNLRLQLEKHAGVFDSADTVLVLSCGVGVQTVSEVFESKAVFAACDTYHLPGYQGVTPLEYDCDQCGECHLNETGGICPITACSKSLVNGQCGGSKNGKCEVDQGMECGWERIYRRLEQLGQINTLRHPVKIKNYAPDMASKESE